MEQISLCVLQTGHKRHPDSVRRSDVATSRRSLMPPAQPKYRQFVLGALLLRNRKLDWLDAKPVTIEERVAAYAAALGPKREQEAEQYRFQAALVANCTMPMLRRLHPVRTARRERACVWALTVVVAGRRQGRQAV